MIDFIFDYSFFISIAFLCASIIYKARFSESKIASGLLVFSILAFSFPIIYANFTHRPHHCNCESNFIEEANNIAFAIDHYFLIPNRTQVPSISDLVNAGNYVLLENRDSKRRAKLVKKSEFSVAILGDDVNEITIVVSSKEGRCPFLKGKCPWSKGQVYVLRMGEGVLRMEESEVNEWLDSLEEINPQI